MTISRAAIGIVLLVIFTHAAEPLEAAAGGKPNILFILIDDLGWMDLHCQGNANLHTPHIDDLSREGMRFTDAYAPSPVCSPTRAAILTGLSPARLHITRESLVPPTARDRQVGTRCDLLALPSLCVPRQKPPG